MNQIKEWWKNLDAKKRQLIFIGAVTMIGFSCIFLVMDNTGGSKTDDPNAGRARVARDVVTQTFTGANTRDMDLHGIAAQMREMSRTIDSVNSKYDNLTKQMASREKAQQEAISRAVQDAKGNLANQTLSLLEKRYGAPFDDIGNMTERLQEIVQEANIATEKATIAAEKNGVVTPSTATPNNLTIPTPAQVYKTEHKVNWDEEIKKEEEETKAGEEADTQMNRDLTLKVVTNSRPKTDENNKEEKESFYLPANTIIHGVLLTGAVVPVGKESKQNPVPILMRIKDDAILANQFSSDVKECFLSASGTGDLSSERVEFRSERIVCVRDDGSALESPIEMWSVGEDGMAGVRGKLVHKAGSLVAQATLAATVDSFSQMFSLVPVPTLNTTSSSKTPYQQALSGDSLQAASIQGLSGGLSRLTEYLMDLADQILPVLEVHALREIGFVVVKGKKLEFTETVKPRNAN